MEPNDLAVIGYVLQALGFAVLSFLFLGRRDRFCTHFGIASAASSLLGIVLAFYLLRESPLNLGVVLAEWTRNLLWILALFVVLRTLDKQKLVESNARRFGLPILIAVFAGLLAYSSKVFGPNFVSVIASGGILMALALVSLCEQVYRNLPSDSTSGLKYVCVALFVVSAYDMVLFLRTISMGVIEDDVWAARGFINVLVVFPLALYFRGRGFDSTEDMPRQFVLYRSSLLAGGTGAALFLMFDSFVGNHGAAWSNVATIVLGAAILGAAAILLVSASTRARIRVFLTKFFFRYKYDYRKEWLRFISTLSESGLENVPATAVRAVAQIVSSPGGIVWVQDEDGRAYAPVGSWRCDIPGMTPIGSDSPLVRFLIDRHWVIDLEEKQRYPARYGSLELGASLRGSDEWWLIVPLFLGKRLFGFVWLKKPRVVRSLNFEDHDLLRTVGRHVGMHINQAESDKRLAESSQFGTYNRLTAFLMHDLNNLIAQQSLVVKNAERFSDDPQFVDDAIDTIANSVARMKRLMEQLTRGFKTPEKVRTDLREVMASAVRRSEALRPQAKWVPADESAYVMADPERLTNILEHLIRNAQDATADNGRIELSMKVAEGLVYISVSDTGEGMSPEFIRERLFRPFDSTKGSHAMGIGVYQAREYARMLGGQLEVESNVGQGTKFTLRLPVAN